MDPPALSRGSRIEEHASGQMQSYIRPLGEDILCLRALMKSALPRLITTAASRALYLRSWEEAGLTVRVINSITPRMVRKYSSICLPRQSSAQIPVFDPFKAVETLICAP